MSIGVRTYVMVRTYKRVAGSRNYKNYTDEALEEALVKITDGDLSIFAASSTYKIPYGTLYNKYKGCHGRTVGGQSVFTHDEEISILRAAATCADYGFPLSTLDLRMFAKAYLDRQGKLIDRFTNNLPGIDWALSLLKRHKNAYGQRVSTNIKRSRASVGRESLNIFFDNLKKEVDGIPPSHIFNYDESNVSDDPGKKKCIYRRGVKYPEKIMNFTKSCTTIMICGSADGTLLPPYVIYKSTHLYDTWKERGIVGSPCCSEPCCSRGSRYNRTMSGWIDSVTFRDWFFSVFLPHAKRLEGRTVLIGDNLSSHIDTDVLDACKTHNVSFVCLVPNSTHLTQPLDVAFFRPMKGAWRKTLENWKKHNMRSTTVPKEVFPNLLKEALLEMDKTPPKNRAETVISAVRRNLIAGFEATGIFPFNREKVLQKIPNETSADDVDATVRDTLTDFLEKQRFGIFSEPTRKKKRLAVEPGKSVATLDDSASPIRESSNASEPVISLDEPGPSSAMQNCSQTSSDVNNQLCPPLTRLEKEKPYHVFTDDDITDCESVQSLDGISEDNNSRGLKIGQFILAKFGSVKGKKTYQYVCMIEEINDEKLVVQGFKSIKKSKRDFRVVNGDISIIEESDVISYLPTPKLTDECYVFPSDVNIKEL